MARCVARKSGVHLTTSTSISFKKDAESGRYQKIEQNVRSNHLEHTTKKSGKPIISEETYCIGTVDNWDYQFEVTGFDGKPHIVYFVRYEDKK